MKHNRNARRKGALQRLRAQLESGVKPSKTSSDKSTPLSKTDISRIEREISILEGRVV